MKVIKWLDKNFEKYILVFLLVMMLSVLSLNVFLRIFNAETHWAARVAQLCLVISSFFSVSYCIRRGSSLKIDLLLKSIPPIAQKIMVFTVKLILLILFSLLAIASWGTLGQYLELGTTDAALGIPLSNFYILVFIGFVVTVIRCIQSLFFEFFPEKNPEVLAKMIPSPTLQETAIDDGGEELVEAADKE